MDTRAIAEIEQRVRQLGEEQPWWHDIELPHGVHTIGRTAGELCVNHNVAKWRRITDLLDFQGKSVLDLGCNEGFFCHQALACGATRVVGVDVNALRIKKARFVADTLKSQNLLLLERSVYELGTDQIGGRCDIVLALGLLHRVPDPYGLLTKATELGDVVVLEWSASKSPRSVMEFWGGDYKAYDRDNTGYWRMSRACAREILLRAGCTAYYDVEPEGSRAVLIAARTSEHPALKRRWKSLADAVEPQGGLRKNRFGRLPGRLLRNLLGPSARSA